MCNTGGFSVFHASPLEVCSSFAFGRSMASLAQTILEYLSSKTHHAHGASGSFGVWHRLELRSAPDDGVVVGNNLTNAYADVNTDVSATSLIQCTLIEVVLAFDYEHTSGTARAHHFFWHRGTSPSLLHCVASVFKRVRKNALTAPCRISCIR